MNTICFIGHRKIEDREELKDRLYIIIEDKIVNQNFTTFLFGSRSEFNDLCLSVVNQLKRKYIRIKMIYVRAEYPFINQDYHDYLLALYDDTFFHESLLKAGKSIYVKRNKLMIDKSDLIVFYCSESPKHKSGTFIAYNYALTKHKSIINLWENI